MHKLLASILSLLLSISLLAPVTCGQARPIAVLPQPVVVTAAEGVFLLRPDTLIVSDKANQRTARMLAQWLAPATGYTAQAESAGGCR